MKNKILNLEELEVIVKKLMPDHRIVLTNGCFDLLHTGHVRYLNKASNLGDILIIAVNSDQSVKKLKGGSRPLIPLNERMELLAALEAVDYVTDFSTETCSPVIKRLKPDIYVKGGDYSPETLPEWNAVHEYGGDVKFIEMTTERSTSGIIEKIISSHKK
ncbi:D-glycero-beta-D-manno-heptose 1-phosphate adenylyltransferase [Halanaerobiaceae bacterium Z-7014]|uniref:D-glycero-beta-D-manno-heptose 1-phosphate adenylyltransferase n=1 Tax=Halonatronomonas betaini TaxID=2778430 RepID=A0A931AT54_9FIRM|nr:D-glycero-beta-D-manno-heptose 1-phosphate adenylyltransferase [Halonatronomonas betaini]MBF8435721.1 D-glycero-beta-D-manno-heptose 1-phosphate adenylyltransferase [Halonatronomonas betaini]